MKSKYKNIKVNGFDSKKEYFRALQLDIWQKANVISDLKFQVKFILIPALKENNKTIERECSYIADFTYFDKDKNFIIEDVKGYKTEVYKIKRKLMRQKGLIITEI